MDDIFLYILVITIIIIIIIVIYNYSKNIEKFSLEDLPLLYCHVFKKNDGSLIDDFPKHCDLSPNNKFKKTITIPANKGNNGDKGQDLDRKVENIDNEYKCNNCTRVDNKIKTSIKNIITQDNLTINPGIIIPNYVSLNTNDIIIKDVTGIRKTINKENIDELINLKKSYLKCNDENKYNTEAGNIVRASIGECTDCTNCPTGKYSTCGGPNNIKGECIECSQCPQGKYMDGCIGRNSGECKQNICNCDNGIRAVGPACLNNGDDRCISCDQGYELNDEDYTCTECPSIPEYSTYHENSCNWYCNTGYELHEEDQCLKQCSAGEKRDADDNTCVPCEIDTYKYIDPGETHTDTECSQCPIGSTTLHSTGNDSCEPKPGYEYDSIEETYKPKEGNIDNNKDGEIESCQYNYKFNQYGNECIACQHIEDGTYEPNPNPNLHDCSNIICNPGYELVGSSCQACGRDRYKGGTNSNNCSDCPIGSTTNSNQTATAITDCTARLGYEELNGSFELKQGYRDGIEGIEDADGTIDGCLYNYGYNEENECTFCPEIDYGGYDENQTPNDCSNKVCNAGYEFNNESCRPCAQDYYKDGKNKNNCSECPIGSTTGDNTGQQSIDDCTARPGYEKQSDSIYDILAGYVDNVPADGTIDACKATYYYDGTNCLPCNYGDGVICPGGNSLDNSSRTLKPNYSWNGNTAAKCPEGEKRDGDVTIQVGDSNITCNLCETIPPNSHYTVGDDEKQEYDEYGSCRWECDTGYQQDGNDCLIECQAGEKRDVDDNICVPCDVGTYKQIISGEKHTDTECSSCPSGSTTERTGTQSDTDCLILCDENLYRDTDTNTCIPCDTGTYKAGKNTFATCTSSCAADEYYDETACPENSSRIGNNCVCNRGYIVVEREDGYVCTELQTPAEEPAEEPAQGPPAAETLNYEDECNVDGKLCQNCPDGLYYRPAGLTGPICQPVTVAANQECSEENGESVPSCDRCEHVFNYQDGNKYRCSEPGKMQSDM